MGHHISAMICHLPIDTDSANECDLPVFIEGDFAIIALNPYHSDHWAEKLGIDHYSFSDMLFDNQVTREFAKILKIEKYALINTEYFGGVGTQSATVYENNKRIFKVTEGGINRALALIGVVRENNKDEFECLNLGKYRRFCDYFEKYYD